MDNFDFYVKAYKDANWKSFMKGVKPSGVKVKGIPQDIVDAVIHVLGRMTVMIIPSGSWMLPVERVKAVLAVTSIVWLSKTTMWQSYPNHP